MDVMVATVDGTDSGTAVETDPDGNVKIDSARTDDTGVDEPLGTDNANVDLLVDGDISMFVDPDCIVSLPTLADCELELGLGEEMVKDEEPVTEFETTLSVVDGKYEAGATII